MLSLTRTSGYAILALSCLYQRGGEWVQARSIADCSGVSLPYLSKLLHALSKAELVLTKRGYRGGYQLARPASKISLLEVVQAVEGARENVCLLGMAACSDERACPLHAFWSRERERIERELARQTLRDVAQFEAGRESPLHGNCRTRRISESKGAAVPEER